MSKDNEKAPQRDTSYVVLTANEDGSYAVSATVSAATADAAKRTAAAQIEMVEGAPLTLVTVPARSWQPETFKVERPAPRLVKA